MTAEIGSYFIRDLEIKPALVLAPMSGVTTSAFRRLIKEHNPGSVGLVISEFISVEGMTRQIERSLSMMRYDKSESPVGIQIFGHDINRMRDAAMMVEQSGVDLLDINCGCPAPKVVKRGGGCELMRQPEHLSKIIREVRKAVKMPLTIKIRSGWDSESVNAVEIAKMAESEGVEAITVHGRTRVQLYRGDADWQVVSNVAKAVKIPVLGSGDVVNTKSALDRLAFGAKGLFIGRAAIANPFVFSEIMGQSIVNRANRQDLVLNLLERYVSLLLEEFPAKRCVGRFKQLVSQCCRGFSWRKDLCTAMTFEEQLKILACVRSGVGKYKEPEIEGLQSETQLNNEVNCAA